MFTFNGKQYAASKQEFDSILGAHGYYKVKGGRGRVAILLMDAAKEPMALISPDGATVTASRIEGGIFYMYGTTKETERFLGIGDMKYSSLMQLGRLAIENAKQEIEVTA